MKAFDTSARNASLRRFALFVVAPFLLCAAYLLFIASPRYESEALFYVRSLDSGNNPSSGLFSAFVAEAGGVSHEDAAIIQRYILSTDLADALNEEHDLQEKWSAPSIDFLNRLDADADFDDFHSLYVDHVDAALLENGILRVRAKGFTPSGAETLLAGILRKSESFVNTISRKLADEQIGYVQEQVEQLEDRLREIRERRIQFENREQSLDLTSDTQMIYGNIAALETEKAQKEAELSRLQSFLAPESAQVRSLQSEIEALGQQIRSERLRLAGSDSSLNAILVEGERLRLEEEFAMSAYTSAYQALESVRLEAIQKLKSLVVIQSPRSPADPRYPRISYWLPTIALVLSLIYLILSLIVSVIKDHSE